MNRSAIAEIYPIHVSAGAPDAKLKFSKMLADRGIGSKFQGRLLELAGSPKFSLATSTELFAVFREISGENKKCEWDIEPKNFELKDGMVFKDDAFSFSIFAKGDLKKLSYTIKFQDGCGAVCMEAREHYSGMDSAHYFKPGDDSFNKYLAYLAGELRNYKALVADNLGIIRKNGERLPPF